MTTKQTTGHDALGEFAPSSHILTTTFSSEKFGAAKTSCR